MLASNHPPKDVRIFEREALSLVRQGHRVTMLAPARSPETSVDRGATIHTVVAGGHGLSTYPVTLFRLFRQALQLDVDVVHCHEPESLLIGVVLKWVKGVKLIYDAHEHYPSLYFSKGKTWKSRLLYAITEVAERFGVWWADQVITVNQTLYERFSGRKPVTIVYNVPPLALFNPDRIDLALVARWVGKVIVLHQGSLSESRGLSTLLEAMAQVRRTIPQAHLVILGKIDGTIPGAMRESVEVIPWVPYAQVAHYINASSVGLILFRGTHYNNTIGLPNKLFDYMACATPVVASDLIEIRRVVEGHQAGLLVPPEDPVAVADALVQLLTDANRAADCGRNGAKAVKETYNWEHMEERLRAVYERLY